jgi:putative SOS response-associated peptidase YedK
MCGHYALYRDACVLAQQFGVEAPVDIRPCYIIAPTQTIPILRLDAGQRRFGLAALGFDSPVGPRPSIPAIAPWAETVAGFSPLLYMRHFPSIRDSATLKNLHWLVLFFFG